ncbi:hypothetical protein LPJ64_004141 [Coemansia asiatica]|uniref:CMP/dCMP-type deaminase domain-containing protein n=1 Tax=Coemansia asiatica TaxID=1052880 RepID=A0A9W7XIG7_9FUNG|nr:hypothetical protein LPJ64_004141 [Coemansia asiatica]
MLEEPHKRRGTFTIIDHDDGGRQVELHTEFMRLAIMQANMALPSNNSFTTGVLLVNGMQVVSEGHSRESHAPTLHAAASAITKARQNPHSSHLVPGSTLYTTMEPCSSENVSKVPCTKFIIDAGISKVVIGVKEPDSFIDCNGVKVLCNAGIDVVHLLFLQEECLAPNIHLLT